MCSKNQESLFIDSDDNSTSFVKDSISDPEISQHLSTSFPPNDISDAEADQSEESEESEELEESEGSEGSEGSGDLENDQLKEFQDLDMDVDPDKTVQQNPQQSTTATGEVRNRPSSCVFVASLAASLTDDELSLSVTNHFKQWGELALVKVLRDSSNRPYAFVQYSNDKDAKKALKHGQHSILDGRAIRCEPAKVNRTLYIATTSGSDIPIKEIKDILTSFGEIEQIIGNNDNAYRKSNLNKAWFCQFAFRDDAIRAYANLRLSLNWVVEWAQNIESPTDSVERSVSFSDDSTNAKTTNNKYSTNFIDESTPEVVIDNFSIFIGQLDSKVTKDKLVERFSRHGKVIDCTLVLRPGNNFAFIKFDSEQAAASAVEKENHTVFLEKTMHVQYRELHHKKASSFHSFAPRLNLAPPPVHLPSRRASTGSVLNHQQPQTILVPSNYKGNRFGNMALNHQGPSVGLHRSVSFSNDKAMSQNHHHNQQPRFRSGQHYFASNSRRESSNTSTPQKSFPAPTEKQVTPATSPSNNTNNSSQGESKSVYSAASTISVSENQINDDVNNPTTTATTNTTSTTNGPIKFNPQRRSSVPHNNYYYYVPKDNFSYDQSGIPAGYLPPPPPPPHLPHGYQTSFPYYYPADPASGAPAGLVDYNAPAPVNMAAAGPAPYYMYYGIPPYMDIKDPIQENKNEDHQSQEQDLDY